MALSKSNELTWDQTLRFRLLEIILQWEGRLITNHLCTAFNIGRQQASRDINRYINEFAPDGLTYDRQLKGYKPTKQFTPQFSQGTVNEYLHLLHREKNQASMVTLMDLNYGHTGRFSLYVLVNIFIPPDNHDFASSRRCSFILNQAK